MAVDPRTPRQRYLTRLRALEKEYSPWRPVHQDIAEHIAPGTVRVMPGDRVKAALVSDTLINSTPRIALRTLSAGCMSGITSPARPWLALGTPNPELAERPGARVWLNHVSETMLSIFARSNLYNALPVVYSALGAHGVAAMAVEDDPDDIIRCYVWPTGSYWLAQNARLKVDSAMRRQALTVAQLVEAFGLGRVSPRVKNLWERGIYDEWVEVLRCIEPNRERDPERLDAAGMAYRSAWMEYNDGGSQELLDVKGYREFPVLAPRWDVVAEDVYGRGPGFESLPDCRALQTLERRKLQAADKLVNPPMVGPASLKNQRAALLPGDVTYVDATSAGNSFQPAYSVPPAALSELREDIREHSRRIEQAFFADLWLMMAMDDRRQPVTAREIAERHEEKLLQLGPVLSRLHAELLDPLVDRTFSIMLRRGMVPPPPRELEGTPLRVEYISILSQAQRLVGIASDERLAGMVGNIAAVKPDILDKIDWDKFVEGYAQKTSADPDVLVPQDKVDALRAARAQAQKAAMDTQQNLPAAAQSAKVLSETDVQGDSALNRLLYSIGGGAGVPPALPGAGGA